MNRSSKGISVATAPGAQCARSDLEVARRINGERVVLLGWSRAILMHLAHPLIAAGVLAHSTFRGGAIEAAQRLHHTVGAMLALTFGDERRRNQTLTGIRAIHRRVNGTLPESIGRFPAGTRYSAEDPELLLWVHATLLDSNADVYQRVVAPLTDDQLDAWCRASADMLDALGGNPQHTPRTWAALQRYLQEVMSSDTLAVSPPARALGHLVLTPRAAGLPFPLASSHRLLTSGVLPPLLRDAYALPWDAARQQAFERRVKLLRVLRRGTPSVIARWA